MQQSANAPASNASVRPAQSPVSSELTGAAAHHVWKQIVDKVRTASPRHGKSLAFGRLVRVAPGEVVIGFTSESDFHRTTVSGAGKAIIEQAMSEVTGRPTRLVIDANGAQTAPPSIAEEEAKERAAHERSVDYRVRHHPALVSAMRILGGELEHVQVLERERPAVVEADPSDESN